MLGTSVIQGFSDMGESIGIVASTAVVRRWDWESRG